MNFTYLTKLLEHFSYLLRNVKQNEFRKLFLILKSFFQSKKNVLNVNRKCFGSYTLLRTPKSGVCRHSINALSVRRRIIRPAQKSCTLCAESKIINNRKKLKKYKKNIFHPYSLPLSSGLLHHLRFNLCSKHLEKTYDREFVILTEY